MKQEKPKYKNVNSAYILMHIFSFIDKQLSFKIIYGNKNIIKKLDITLDDFKKVSGKIIIRKRKDFALSTDSLIDYVYIQDTDIIVFKGHYKNGKKNGEGTEFYINKKKKFEGEYSNGIKINGTGYDKMGNEIYVINYKNVTERYTNKNPVFSGKYLNGKKYNGIGYDINGNKAYEIKLGRGKVKEFFDDGVLKFEGEYYNGERNGQGKRYDYEGEILFEGIYLNGEKWTGKGKEYYSDHDKDDDTNDNPFKNWNFFGAYQKKPKKKDLFSIFGNDDDNDIYIPKLLGSTSKNKKLTRLTKKNFGCEIEKKILKFEGEYLNGQRSGQGKEYNEEGALIYEGEFLNGKWHGIGKQYYDEGLFGNGRKKLLYEGEFKNGKYDGIGKKYEVGIVSTGKIEQQGIFENGKLIEFMKVD